jgi:hypothetical protein
MANASGAVAAALRPIAAVTLPTAVSGGQSVTLSASGSSAANSHTLSVYQWTSAGSQALTIANATSATAAVTAPSCGYGTVQLAVTDDAGRKDLAKVVLSPTSATSSAPTDATIASCSTASTAVTAAVCPGTLTIDTGSTHAFAATASDTAYESVTWEVNGVAGGSATSGTISTDGTYTAPSTVPASPTVTIRAVSTADSSVSATASVTVVAAPKSGGGTQYPFTLLVEGLVAGWVVWSRNRRKRAIHIE